MYVNAGLGDSKVVDVQAGLERGMNFLLGSLAGADLVAHMGISGADQGASLPQLVADNEMIGFVGRALRGVTVDERSLAVDVIEEVGHDGQHLAHEHTIASFRDEFWMPNMMWDRSGWDVWLQAGGMTMAERAQAEVERILNTPPTEQIDDNLANEIDCIVDAARRELL